MTKLLGHTVCDAVSGITGIAEQYIEFLSGTIQYAVQPKGDGFTVPSGYNIDATQLSLIIGRKAASVPTTPPEPTFISLGDMVEDMISGTVGIATRKVTFINGCVYFDVVEHASKIAGKEPAVLFTVHSRLKILAAQHFQNAHAVAATSNRAKLAAAAPTAPEPAKPRTGGPSSAASRM